MAGALSHKQAAFVREFTKDRNGKQAAIRAGYSRNGAEVTGHRLLTNPNVRRKIDAFEAELSDRARVSVDRVVEEYRRIAFSDIREVVSVGAGKIVVSDTASLTPDAAAAISEISEPRAASTKDGLRIRFHSKAAALDGLAKHLGMFVKRIAFNFDALSDAELLQLHSLSQKLSPGTADGAPPGRSASDAR